MFDELQRSVRDFIAWWAREMLDLLPPSLRPAEGDSRDALLVGTDGALALRRDGRIEALGRFGFDAAGLAGLRAAVQPTGRHPPIVLALPPGVILEKPLALPLAAERELAQVLTFEMDRETPFAADEVYWTWEITGRDRGRGQILLRLLFAPKAPLAQCVDSLAQGGLAPTLLESGRRQIPLASRQGFRGAFRFGRTAPLAAACAALAFAALVVPFARQGIALSAIEDRIAQLQPEADHLQQLRRRLGEVEGQAAAQGEGLSVPEALKVLEATTGILPDDTFLTDLGLRHRKLSLTGESAGAAKLIGALASDPTFKDPAFTAAVTRASGAKMDSFSINATVKPP